MPQKAEVTDPKTGRTIEIEWDSGNPPSEQELEQIFASVGGGRPSVNPNDPMLQAAPAFKQKSPDVQGERTLEAFSQPGQLLEKGIGQMQSGYPVAGAVNAARAVVQAPFAPINAAIEYAASSDFAPGRFIGQGLHGVMALPFQAARAFKRNIADPLGYGIAEATGLNKALSAPVNHPTVEALSGAAEEGLGFAMMAGAPRAMQSAAKGAQQYGTNLRARTAEKIGADIGAGESAGGMRRAGQFMVDFDIPVKKATLVEGKRGIPESRSAGATKAREIVSRLDAEMNQKIIEPATEAGVMIDGARLVDSFRKMREEFASALPPDRTAMNALDRIIVDTQNLVKESGGQLTPVQAQALKKLNNKILDKYYEKVEKSGGQLSPLENVKKQARAEINGEMRRSLEDIDPRIRNVNWTEGAGLEVSKALDRFYEARLRRDPAYIRGSGITGAAMGQPRLVGLFAMTELMAFRPFRVAYNKLLNKVGTALSGTPSEFVRPGEVGGNFSIPPMPPPPPTPTGMAPFNPPPPSIGGTPRSGGGFTPSPVDATFTEVGQPFAYLPPRGAAQLGNPPMQRGNVLPPPPQFAPRKVERGFEMPREVASSEKVVTGSSQKPQGGKPQGNQPAGKAGKGSVRLNLAGIKNTPELEGTNRNAMTFLRQYPQNVISVRQFDKGTKITGISGDKARIENVGSGVEITFKNNQGIKTTQVIYGDPVKLQNSVKEYLDAIDWGE